LAQADALRQYALHHACAMGGLNLYKVKDIDGEVKSEGKIVLMN